MTGRRPDGGPGSREPDRVERVLHEARAVVRLAVPVVLAQLGMMLMGIVDTMMLGRVSERALAAGALGHGVGIGLTMFPLGVLMALDPLVAQAHGAGDRRGVRRHLRQGILLAAFLAVPLSLAMWRLEGVLEILGQRPEIAALAASYLRALIPGNLAFLLFVAVRQSLQAMSVVRPALVAIVVANLVNVGANYALVFGNLGFPRLEVLGSAYATSISRWVLVLILVVSAWPLLRRHLRGWRPRLSLAAQRRILGLGTPVGLHLSLEMGVFVTVVLMMGQLGTRELAAHQVAINLAALAFMVPLGISGAAATRVGNAVGRGSLAAARRSALVSLSFGGAVMSFSGLAFWFFPELLSRLFTDELAVVALAATLLPIAAVFQIFDGLQVVAFGALRGTADTRLPALIALFGFWLFGLPLGWWMAFRTGLGAQGLWWGLTAGLGAVAVLLLLRVWRRFSGPIAALDTGARGEYRPG